MDHKTATSTSVTTRHWHRLFLCAGLLAVLGVEECTLGLVSIQSPADGTTFTEAQTVTITASALEGEGLTVEQVRFYRDGDLVYTDTTEPYAYRWNITAADNGTHRFYAEALYRRSDGTTEFLESEEIVYEVDIALPPTGSAEIGEEILLVAGVTQGKVRALSANSEGSLVALVSDGKDLAIVEPSHSVKSFLPLPGTAIAVAAHGTVVYVAEESSSGALTLRTVDARNPRSPALGTSLSIPGQLGRTSRGNLAAGLAVKDSVLYFAGPAGALHRIDISSPLRPRALAPLSFPSAVNTPSAVKVDFAGDQGFVLDNYGFVWTFNAARPGTELTFFKRSSTYDLAADDGLLLVSPGGFRSIVYDVDAPGSPGSLRRTGDDGVNRRLAVEGSMAILRPSFDKFRFFRVSSQLEFDFVTEVQLPEQCHEFVLVGGRAYIADAASNLRVLNAGAP